ncbi:hypothetical protein HQ584_01425, partial [Patescibacteria group bacterium]|nr:hypothetical protein [Patescibacteria group bacterium]
MFNIVQQLFSVGLKEIFYIEQKEDTRWEREEISKLLKELYEKTSNNALKENIIEYVGRTFNLIKDDGEHWHYTPPVIFEILRQHAKEDIENRASELKRIFVCHYMEFYKKFRRKLQFKGWEHMGGITSFWGNQYTVTDRHFVNYILKPALWNYYQKHKIKAWRFIANDC